MNFTDVNALLNYTMYDNTIQQYIIALLIFISGVVVLRLFKYIVLKRLKKWAKKTKNTYDDLVIDAVDAIGYPFYVVLMLNISLAFIQIPEIVSKIVYYIVLATVIFYIIKGIFVLIDFGKKRIIKKKEETEGTVDTSIITILTNILKGAIWVIALLLIAQNLGYNITGLLAGVGVLGIAIAFALQNVLEDLFASFSIFFDKPFVVGDFIIIGNDMGNVEKIGIKSTRIRTLQGQELIISNKELTNTRINNYKIMKERRVSFKIGVAYETPNKKLEQIPSIIKNVIKNTKKSRFDRAHFFQFGDFSLIYEIVYYVPTNDYTAYMDTQQEINLKLNKEFQKKKIVFAYPTQTLYFSKAK